MQTRAADERPPVGRTLSSSRGGRSAVGGGELPIGGACRRYECERKGGWDGKQEDGESSSHGST